MGAGIENNIFSSSLQARAMSVLLKVLSILTLFWIVWLLDGNLANFLIIGILGFVLILMDH
jgi:hypothetical protein